MLTSKKQEKIEKILGLQFVHELDALASSELKEKVAQAEGAVKQAQDELEANDDYNAMKESLKDLSAGMKEVKKRQRAIVAYSLHLLEEKGK